MYVLVLSVQILHLVCSSFSPHGCRVGAGSDVQASEGLLRDPRAVPEHPIPPGSISVLPTPLPCLPPNKPPASCSPPHLKGGCELGGRGDSEGRDCPKGFKTFWEQAAQCLSESGRLAMPHAALSIAKWNPRPAPGSSLEPAPRCSQQPQKWFLAGCRCAGGICSHFEPALFGRAVVVWHLLE